MFIDTCIWFVDAGQLKKIKEFQIDCLDELGKFLTGTCTGISKYTYFKVYFSVI